MGTSFSSGRRTKGTKDPNHRSSMTPTRCRPGWPRAYSRIGAALISLRRLEEARANYEEGLQSDSGSAELQTGLSDVLGDMDLAMGWVTWT